MLNDKVIPFYDSYEVKVMNILADRGAEYYEAREYQQKVFDSI